MNNSFLALPVGRVGWGYSKKLFINSNVLVHKIEEKATVGLQILKEILLKEINS